MSDYSLSIIPKLSEYPNKNLKSKEILAWLTSLNIVLPVATECVLGSENGYPIAAGAKDVTNSAEELTFNLITNGLEIITERNVFHTGGNGMDQCICPNCKMNIASEDWSFINDWADDKTNNLTCPLCNATKDINKFLFSPDWGFSDLGFTFWNWPNFTEEFIEEFRKRLACDISIVYCHT